MVEKVKITLIGIGMILGKVLTYLLGGWTPALKALLLFMAFDYVTGLWIAGIMRRSRKTPTGSLSSATGLIGIGKKAGMLMMVAVGYHLDNIAGTEIIKSGVTYSLIGVELISLTENWGIMGLPVPKVLREAIDALVNKDNKGGNNVQTEVLQRSGDEN